MFYTLNTVKIKIQGIRALLKCMLQAEGEEGRVHQWKLKYIIYTVRSMFIDSLRATKDENILDGSPSLPRITVEQFIETLPRSEQQTSVFVRIFSVERLKYSCDAL